jgi:hypothetical protein
MIVGVNKAWKLLSVTSLETTLLAPTLKLPVGGLVELTTPLLSYFAVKIGRHSLLSSSAGNMEASASRHKVLIIESFWL